LRYEMSFGGRSQDIMGDLTQIMDAVARGDRQAAGQLLPQVQTS
jgi:hypothetical protein